MNESSIVKKHQHQHKKKYPPKISEANLKKKNKINNPKLSYKQGMIYQISWKT